MSLIATGYLMELSKLYYMFLILIIFQLFFLQLNKLNIKDSSICLKVFKSNNILGLIVFLSILIGKIL